MNQTDMLLAALKKHFGKSDLVKLLESELGWTNAVLGQVAEYLKADGHGGVVTLYDHDGGDYPGRLVDIALTRL